MPVRARLVLVRRLVRLAALVPAYLAVLVQLQFPADPLAQRPDLVLAPAARVELLLSRRSLSAATARSTA